MGIWKNCKKNLKKELRKKEKKNNQGDKKAWNEKTAE